MKKLAYLAVLPFVASCGSTGTDSTGDDDDDGSGPSIISCADINVTAPLSCTNDVNGRATLAVSVGTGAGTVAAGDDQRFGGSVKYLGSFTPSTSQTNPPTRTNPGGQMAGQLGALIYNDLTDRAGITAADEICASITDWPGYTGPVTGAHACSNDELIRATATGQIPAGSTGLAYTSVGFRAGGANGQDLSAFKASCGGWTYRSADAFGRTTWIVNDQNNNAGGTDLVPGTGTTLSINFLTDEDGATGATATASCGTAAPIACCL